MLAAALFAAGSAWYVQSLPSKYDGESIVASRDGQTAQLWDIDTAEPIGLPMYHQGAVLACYDWNLAAAATLSVLEEAAGGR